jgi:aspartyl-tRNA(Asn)/glutamyl-tRNA(Gln) amidotransferase subunit B
VKPLRSKEESHDYRYFPDPDLPPLVLAPAWVEDQRGKLPELPDAKRARLMAAHGLPAYDAGVIASERGIADYFEAVLAAGAEPKAAANWIINDAMTGYNESGGFRVSPASLAELIGLVARNVVSQQAAKKIFPELGNGGSAQTVAERLGLVQVSDTGALAGWVDDVIRAHPGEVERYRAGEKKLIGFFVGQVMKKSQGKADPKGVQPVLLSKLG